MRFKNRQTAKYRVLKEPVLSLMMGIARKGRVTIRTDKVPTAVPEGVQVGSLRKATGMILSIRPEPQMMESKERMEIDPRKPEVSQSSSFLERTRVIAEKKKKEKAIIVEVLPGWRKASKRLGVFKRVERSQEAAKASKGRPKGVRNIRTWRSLT